MKPNEVTVNVTYLRLNMSEFFFLKWTAIRTNYVTVTVPFFTYEELTVKLTGEISNEKKIKFINH